MLSATSIFCAAFLLTGNLCDPVRTLDQITRQAHDDLAGEHWYQVNFQQDKIGSLQETRSQLPTGEFAVTRSLRFSLMSNRITHITEQSHFSSTFPYELLSAEQITTVTHHGNSKSVRRVFPIEATKNSRYPPLTYLSTLAFHPHFVGNNDRITLRSVDFARNRYISHTWQVNVSTEDGVAFRLTSNDGLSTHLISSAGKSVQSSGSGGISTLAVDHAEDESWNDGPFIFDSTEVSVPVDQSIDDPRRLESLTLQIHGSREAKGLWGAILDSNDTIRIDRRNPPIVAIQQLRHSNLSESDNAFALVAKFLTDSNLGREVTYEAVQRLVDELDDRISYEDISEPSSLVETLERKTGDCTEFADVFDAVATHLGWNSRIRTGLAYHAPSQSFRPHSWNEIDIDGRWISADASWGQFPADATHVPFPRANTLALLAQASSTRFEVVDQRYQTN